MNKRIEHIIEIAKNNALEALDCGGGDAIYDYETNMRQTVAQEYPDYTNQEAIIMEETFFKIVQK